MISKSKQYSSDGSGTKLDISLFVCLCVLLWALALFFCTSFCQGTYHCACGERDDSLYDMGHGV